MSLARALSVKQLCWLDEVAQGGTGGIANSYVRMFSRAVLSLRSLEARGLVEEFALRGGGSGWRLTEDGRAFVAFREAALRKAEGE